MAQDHMPHDYVPTDPSADSQRRRAARTGAAPGAFEPADDDGWGGDGALVRELFAAALGDVAPSAVRERVLAAVDALLIEQAAVTAFPAEAAPVTTLSGVFEKRPGAQPASCVEPGSSDGVIPAAVIPAAVIPAAVIPAAVDRPVDALDVSLRRAEREPLVPAGALVPAAAIDALLGWADTSHDAASLVDTPAGPPVSVVSGASHCHGGPMLGRRCWSDAIPRDGSGQSVSRQGAAPQPLRPCELDADGALRVRPLRAGALRDVALPDVALPDGALPDGALPDVALPDIALPDGVLDDEVHGAFARAARHAFGDGAVPANPTLPGPVPSTFRAASPAASSPARVRRSGKGPWLSARSSFPEETSPSNVDTAFAISDRALAAPSRLRDSVRSGAFNLAQLAAAVVVGIVIGKGAHLVMKEDGAPAWASTAGAEHGLRSELSRTPGPASASGEAGPSDTVEPARRRAALGAWELEPEPAAPDIGAGNISGSNAAGAMVAGATVAGSNGAGAARVALNDAVASDASALDARLAASAASGGNVRSRLDLDERLAASRSRVGSRGRAAPRVGVRSSALWTRSGARRIASRGMSSRALSSRPPVSFSAVEGDELGANARPTVPCTVASAEPHPSLSLSPAPLPALRGAGRPWGAGASPAGSMPVSAGSVPGGASLASAISNGGLADAAPSNRPSACAASLATGVASHVAGAGCAPGGRCVSGALLARSAPGGMLARDSHAASSFVPSGHPSNIRVPLLEPSSDDWLGEQLAILARAERGLLEGDSESAVRSLDEYQARFPNGLLNPQMAAVRERIEDRFTAFIFP